MARKLTTRQMIKRLDALTACARHDHPKCETRLFGRCLTCESHARLGCTPPLEPAPRYDAVYRQGLRHMNAS